MAFKLILALLVVTAVSARLTSQALAPADEDKDHPVFSFDKALARCREDTNGNGVGDKFSKTKNCLAWDESAKRCRDINTGQFVQSKHCVKFDKSASRCRNKVTGRFAKTEHCIEMDGDKCRDKLNGQFVKKEICDMLK